MLIQNYVKHLRWCILWIHLNIEIMSYFYQHLTNCSIVTYVVTGLTWNCCIQILYFQTCIVDFEQVNARLDVIHLKFNALFINPSHFKDSWIYESFVLWLFKSWYWDPKLLPRWHQIQLRWKHLRQKLWEILYIAESLM